MSLEGPKAVARIEWSYEFANFQDSHLHLRDLYEGIIPTELDPGWAIWSGVQSTEV